MPFQWWRSIAPLLPRGPVRLGDETVDLSRSGAIPALARRMEILWRTQRPESYLPLLGQLIDAVCLDHGVTKDQLEPLPAITAQEIRKLGQSGLIRFESHGVAHTAVSAMTPEEIAAEMKSSRDRVAELPVTVPSLLLSVRQSREYRPRRPRDRAPVL